MKVTIEVTTVSEARQSIVLLQAYIASVDGSSSSKPAAAAKPVPEEVEEDEAEEEKAPAKPKLKVARGGAAKKAAPKREEAEDAEDGEDGAEGEAEAGEEDLSDILDEKPKAAKLDKAPQRSLEDVREEARRFATKHSAAKLVEVLKEKFGVGRLTDLEEASYNDCYAHLLFYGSKSSKKKED